MRVLRATSAKKGENGSLKSCPRPRLLTIPHMGLVSANRQQDNQHPCNLDRIRIGTIVILLAYVLVRVIFSYQSKVSGFKVADIVEVNSVKPGLDAQGTITPPPSTNLGIGNMDISQDAQGCDVLAQSVTQTSPVHYLISTSPLVIAVTVPESTTHVRCIAHLRLCPFNFHPVNVQTISCASVTTTGTIKAIKFASYGTPTGVCGKFMVTASCHAERSMNVLVGRCVGKRSCDIPDAYNEIFGRCTPADTLHASCP